MTNRNRKPALAKQQPLAEEAPASPAEDAAPGLPGTPAEPNTGTPAAPPTDELSPAPRRSDSRVEVVTVGECYVDGCPVLEFEPGRGLCMGHFTTRLDLREVARHG